MPHLIDLGDNLPNFSFNSTIGRRKKYWLPKKGDYIHKYYTEKYKHPLFKNVCSYLFTTLIINPDGEVFPCCYLTDKNDIFGDLLKDSISTSGIMTDIYAQEAFS